MDGNKDHVVIKNGQRQTGLLEQSEAERQANAMREKLGEAQGHKANESQVQVKQNLFGAITVLIVPTVSMLCGFTFTSL